MNVLRDFCGVATAVIVVSAAASSALAQENTATYSCQDVGVGPPEPLGDREGHSITVGGFSCRIDTGPMKGGVVTGSGIWEWDGTNAVSLAHSSVARMPGATVVWQGTDGKLALTMADGKVTGWTGSGKGHLLLATGSAASQAGKSTTWTGKSTGPGQFTIEENW